MNPIVTLKRISDTGFETLGELSFNDFLCKTLERPWKSNIPFISCVPKGLYDVRWCFSLKLMQFTYQLLNVSNRAGIRLHKGNFFFDVDGCILLGDSFADINGDGKMDVTNSTITLAQFVSLMGKKDFQLRIV